jgi:hypothetical protein
MVSLSRFLSLFVGIIKKIKAEIRKMYDVKAKSKHYLWNLYMFPICNTEDYVLKSPFGTVWSGKKEQTIVFVSQKTRHKIKTIEVLKALFWQ